MGNDRNMKRQRRKAQNEVKPRLLLIGKTPGLFNLLASEWKRRAWRVRSARSAETALKSALALPPDLILVEQREPELDGLGICERVKAEPALKSIPVLFVGTAAESHNIARAFAVGGADWIVPPFQLDEIFARISRHLESAQCRRKLEDTLDQLAHSRELHHVLLRTLRHDICSPLSVASAYLELIESNESAGMSPNGLSFITEARKAIMDTAHMLGLIVEIHKLRTGEQLISKDSVRLDDLLPAILELHSQRMDKRRISWKRSGGKTPVIADSELISRVVQKLLVHVSRLSREDSSIVVNISVDGRMEKVTVSDREADAPAEHEKRVFEKLGHASEFEPLSASDLELAFCKCAVEAQGGKMGLIGEPGQNLTYWFSLPRAGSD
jgi:DNA-binding response OmpR family regulator